MLNAQVNRRIVTMSNEDLIKRAKKLHGKVVKVGFPKDQPLGNSSGASYASTMSEVATVAVYNELGTSTIPPRPFLRPSMVENVSTLSQICLDATKSILDGSEPFLELSKVGEWSSLKVKDKIIEVSSPSNAVSTIVKKGSSNPLIDSALMVNSVTYVVGEK